MAAGAYYIIRPFQPKAEQQILNRHLTDLYVYLLLPALAVLLPAGWSRSLVARSSRWRWLFREQVELSLGGARRVIGVTDADAWRNRWRQVEMLEARDLFLLTCGRRSTVFGEIAGREQLEICRDRVLVGMHWGPSISILGLLAEYGLAPAMLHRPVDRALLRLRPFYWLFLHLASREILRACGGQVIHTSGAGDRLREAMRSTGSPIVLFDAPPTQGRPVMEARVLGQRVVLHAGFPRLLEQGEGEYVQYAVSLSPDGRLTKILELDGPQRASDGADFVRRYCAFLERHLAADPAQWRIWHAVDQLFQPQDGD